ncbi:hypothetical protein NLI96_g10521 [Meripilus lineatus]|uniref:Uncharacterized protein n=1 Tax=Meripilus lineatus TaxID=2056292 RepID=A0AAD5UTF6_9APHY|nr:hypothetical protein NLI96_g10521 [Physisporinus lineatus]
MADAEDDYQRKSLTSAILIALGIPSPVPSPTKEMPHTGDAPMTLKKIPKDVLRSEETLLGFFEGILQIES